MQRAVTSGLVIVGCCVASASATVVFQDDFEAHTVGTTLNAPQVGTSWTEGANSGANGVSIVGSPAFGTKSVQLTREGAPPLGPSNGDLRGLSLTGALVPGNTVEVKWKVNVENVHRFNGPMQVSLGHEGTLFGSKQLAFVQISDTGAAPLGGGGAYGYYTGPGHFTGGLYTRINNDANNPAVRSSVNTPGANEGRWDAIRMILKVTAAGATGLSGTMDLFIDTAEDPAGEVQIASNSLLETTDFTGVADPSMLQIAFVKGPSSGLTFYDDISVNVVIPEPASLGMIAAVFGMAVRRNRK